MTIKILAIILIIACLQHDLSTGEPTRKRTGRRTTRVSSRVIEDIPRPRQRRISGLFAGVPAKNASSKAQQPVIVEGKKGQILINGDVKFTNDKTFQNGIVNIKAEGGYIYVNNNEVFKHNPTSVVVYSSNTLSQRGVGQFRMEIRPATGMMKYSDDTNYNTSMNYLTNINFG